MGLLDRLRGIKDPVPGTYRLVACSYPSGGAVYENCTMDGVVEADGLTPTAVHHVSLITPVSKWPQPGSVLPVTVDRSNPSRIKIHWDAIPSSAQLGRAAAHQAAAAAAEQAAAAAAPPGVPEDPYAPVSPQAASMFTALGFGPQLQAMRDAQAAAAHAGGGVLGDPGRAVPGAAGGGLTPTEAAQAAAGGGPALGLVAATATVLAAHQIAEPDGTRAAPGGVWDITLDVAQPDSASGWTSVLRVGFSSTARQTDITRTGRTLPVLADPVRHDRIAIDSARLP